MEYTDHLFDGKVIDLDGNTFHRCTFKDCDSIFRRQRRSYGADEVFRKKPN